MQSFFFRRSLDRLRAWHHHRPDFPIHVLPLRHACRRPQVLDARISARSDEHAVDSDFLHRRPRFESHIS